MWFPDENAFREIESWGLNDNPLAAIEDCSDLKKELRWVNKEHRKLYVEYIIKRIDYIGQKNFDDYYKKAKKPIEKIRWEYLMKRKAWFITPLRWDEMTNGSYNIADFGCGDGDTIQRLIHWIDKKWKENGTDQHKVHILGIDLNKSRVENAKNLVESPNPNITYDFQTGDIVGKGLPFKDNHFDFGLITGVLEILEDEPCDQFIRETCRVTDKGIYVEDLFEEFPGGYPRDNLSDYFTKYGFKQVERHVILSEPFDLERSRDPMKLWPVMLDQNLWFDKV